uniref:Roadblock/LAMTOR2 domain-containing protein n=1 Tax=Streptomyces sp. NBC_01401 TaxID=2903854 RepID=A0AAU3H053_9ACTN
MPGIDECLIEVMRLPGARGASVVDWTSGLALGTIGESPNGDHEATAAETAEVARMAAEQPVFAQPALARSDAPTGAPGSPAGSPGPSGPPGRPSDLPGPPASAVEDVIVTTAPGYHILRFVETAFDSSVFLHLWLDRAEGNLALARIRLGEIAERLVLA